MGGIAFSAAEYIDLFGLIDAAHPADQQLVEMWADDVDGAVLDAGCGPGHWAALIAQRGRSVTGVDQVPEFIVHARRKAPGLDFRIGSLAALDLPAESLGGVLAWYSLIHFSPEEIQEPLTEFARVLRPGGSLLIGFFEGPVIDAFDHAVVTAYRWPTHALEEQLRGAGFETTETRVRSTKAQRSQAAIIAQRESAR
ncbi:class I SAM-dependent methyltransferase [Sinomonas albida]|uniref:class I SAM-dependent methyltransferase n=1 Tax=Sinomonas albida TaxID=369942 RepID=UPI0030172270